MLSHPLHCTVLRTTATAATTAATACLNNTRFRGSAGVSASVGVGVGVSLLHTLSRNTRLAAYQSTAVCQFVTRRLAARSFAGCYRSLTLTTRKAEAEAAAAVAVATPTTTIMEGSCLCKAIELKVTDDNLFGSQRRGHLCHCSNCRKVAGGLFGANLAIEEEKVEWVRGRDVVRVYEDRDTLSGKPVYRHFCPDCGVPIMSVAESVKGMVILKLGIYPKLPAPEWETFTADRQAWEKPYEGCVQLKEKSHGEKMEGSP